MSLRCPHCDCLLVFPHFGCPGCAGLVLGPGFEGPGASWPSYEGLRRFADSHTPLPAWWEEEDPFEDPP